MAPRQDDRAPEAALARVLRLVAPLVRLLLRCGVDHTRFASAVKRVFIDEALVELGRRGQKPTHTALSLLTGLQRKDVRRLIEAQPHEPVGKAALPTLPMQVLGRWISDPRFTDESGTPIALPLRATDAEEPGFDTLVRGVSKDVHPQAMLDELTRLGLVHDDGSGQLSVVSEAFVPTREFSQMLDAMARNGSDHLNAAVTNVLAERPQFLEYSLVCDELRPESVQALHDLARRQWRASYKKALVAANERADTDKARGFDGAHEMRIRYGVYFYAEPVSRPGAQGEKDQ